MSGSPIIKLHNGTPYVIGLIQSETFAPTEYYEKNLTSLKQQLEQMEKSARKTIS